METELCRLESVDCGVLLVVDGRDSGFFFCVRTNNRMLRKKAELTERGTLDLWRAARTLGSRRTYVFRCLDAWQTGFGSFEMISQDKE